MQAVYNFRWDNSYSPAGVAYYNLMINGVQNMVYGTSFQTTIPENTSVHAEIVAVDYAGQSSDPAMLDFMVPDYIEIIVRPTTPTGFGAEFVNWQ